MTARSPGPADRRLHAFLLDRLLGWGLVLLAGLLAHWLVGDRWAVTAVVVGSLLAAGLAAALLLGSRGTSPGRAAAGLRVVRESGEGPIGVPAALLRTLLLGLAGLPTAGLGAAALAATALSDPSGRRRGWHDLVCRSAVVDERPPPAEVPVEEGPGHQIVNLTALRLVPAAAQAGAHAASAASPVDARAAEATHGSGPRRGPVRWRLSFDTGETLLVGGLAGGLVEGLVEGLVLVGRQPEPRPGEPARHLVALRSQDGSLSKTHAQLQVAPDGVLVVLDRGATNGTVLVRQGVARMLTPGRPTTLVDGDRVRLGDRELTVAHED